MSDEHKRIDRMLAEGKISPEEAARLRGALEKSEDVAEAPVAEPVTKRRLSKLAVAGALGVPAAIVAALLVYAFGMLIAEGMRGDERAGLAATVTGVAVVLAGFVLSVAALVAIRNNRETRCGKGLAIFGLLAILIPIAALILFCLYLLRSTSPPGSYDIQAITNEIRDDEQIDAARELLSLWQKFRATVDSAGGPGIPGARLNSL
ncbi:MAG: hypothetical protein QGD94_12945 [Planctomycetia bacterium]|nr:hypothetical protein [Planctomycetia bacterium]